ncbi:MAG: DUF4276 family protein [Deltaproteobacteria bacterium]|nr:DUF4276 family protein [Deltaproteobacteria bacterium]
MRIHFLVEGKSEEALLKTWLPRFLPKAHTFKVIPHRGKGKIPKNPSVEPEPRHQGLLDQLPAKLRAYGKALDPDTDRILVLVDLDDEDCPELKDRLNSLLGYCHPAPTALFRIAIEETEAFYLGDPTAIKKAFPKARLNKIDTYRQDSICGTWELFQKTIGAKSEDKVEWARRMGPYLTTRWQGRAANPSHSFQQFCRAILRLAGEPV